MAFCRKEIFIPNNLSKEKFLRKIHCYSEDVKKDFYIEILSQIRNSLYNDNLKDLSCLLRTIKYLNNSTFINDIDLNNSDKKLKNALKCTNVVILACKYNNIRILKWLFSEKMILKSFSTFIGKDCIQPYDEDNECHTAFYYAIRSNNLELLELLIHNWPFDYVTLLPVDIENLLSKSFEMLRLLNIPLTNQMEYYVGEELLNLHFFSPNSNKKADISIDKIIERIDLVVESFEILKSEYSFTQVVDEKFLYVAKFIAENIHTLKKQLKSTYCNLPWEEMEFCLISFICTYIKKQEINIYFRSTLKTSKIISHLENFVSKLSEEKTRIEASTVIQLGKLPILNRYDIITAIIKDTPSFECLYKDYKLIRDICSLEKINEYLNQAIKADITEEEGQMVMMRALQVTGEHLKNTLESPKLSIITSNLLISLVSKNTQNILIKLRNFLSHAHSYKEKVNIENNLDIHGNIQKDLKFINEVVCDILLTEKKRLFTKLLIKFDRTDSDEEIHEIIEIFSCLDLQNLRFENVSNVEGIKMFINLVKDQLTDMTTQEQNLLDIINDFVNQKENRNSFNFENNNFGIIILMEFWNQCTLYNFKDPNVKRVLKYLVKNLLKQNVSEVKTTKDETILNVLIHFYKCLTLRADGNLTEIIISLIKILFKMEHDVSELEGIDNFFKILFTKTKTVDKQICKPSSKDQIEIVISKFKKILDSKPCFRGLRNEKMFDFKNEWQLIMEMLLLDAFSILEKNDNLVNNIMLLDEYTPVLTGKSLRNHLAHFNSIMDIAYFDPLLTILLNVQKLISIDWSRQNLKIGKQVKNDPSAVRSKFYEGLNRLNTSISMFKACEKGSYEELKTLIDKSADINSCRYNNLSTLHYSAKSSNLSIIEYICKNLQDISSCKDQIGRTPLHVAAANGNSEIVSYFIVNKMFNANYTDKRNDTALHVAAFNGHKDIVDFLLNYSKNVNDKNIMGYAAIHCAVHNNKRVVIEYLIEKGVSINTESMGGFTPLHIAAENGYLELVNFLLKKGANVNAKNDKGGIPLHTTALNGHVEVVKALLAYKSNVNEIFFNGSTALQFAVETGQETVVKILLNHGADANLPQVTNKNMPLHCAAFDGKVNIAKLLLENGAYVNVYTSEGLNPFHLAVIGGHLHLVKLLLQYNVEIDSITQKKDSALHLSVSQNNIELTKLLIENGAKVNVKNNEGLSPLHASMSHDNIELISILLYNGADTNSKTCLSRTPLHLSIQSNSIKVLKKLLENGADINLTDKFGFNPLHLAATCCQDSEIIKVLIKLGLDVNSETDIGLTPLHLASKFGKSEIVRLLLHCNASIDAKEMEEGFTPLHFAVENNHRDIVEILIENGAMTNVKGIDHITPLCLAAQKKNVDMIKLLLHNGSNISFDNGKTLNAAVLSGSKSIVGILLNNSNICSDYLRDALFTAVAKNFNNIVEMLILKGADINTKSTSKENGKDNLPPLLLSSYLGFSNVAETLIANGADVNAFSTVDFQTPLHLAAYGGHLKVVKAIINSCKANINAKDFKNRTPLELAIAHGYLEVVKLLSSHKMTDINAKGNNSWTLLHIAAQTGNPKITEFLISSGADINARNKLGSKPFHIAARQGHVQDLKLFINNGNLITDTGSRGFTLLHYASVKGHTEVLKYLISQKVDLNPFDFLSLTPLNYSVEYEFFEFSKFLIENGAFYNVFDKNKIQANIAEENSVMQLIRITENMYNDVKLNKSEGIENYIKKGAFVNGKTVENTTALHFASWKGFDDIVEVLLKNKAAPNIVGKGGSTPLHYATKFNHYKIMLTLLKYGAVYNFRNDKGKIPLEFATEVNILRVLKQIADIFSLVRNCNTKAIQKLKSIESSEILIAVFNCQNEDNKYLLNIALLSNFPKIDSLKKILCAKDSSEISLASILLSHEKYSEALNMYKNVLDRRENAFGPNNPLTLEIQENVADIYYKSGNFQKALNMFSNILSKQTESIGSCNKVTLKTKSKIALILHRLGRDDEALQIFDEVYSKQIEVLDEDDDDVLSTRFHMALSLDAMKNYEEALFHNYEIYKKIKRKFGFYHQYTLSAYNNYAMVLGNKGDYKEALDIYKQVYEGKKKILGVKHSDTMRTLQNIGSLPPKIQDNCDGLKVLHDVYKLQKTELGSNHPDTLNTNYNIGILLFENGKLNEAFKNFSELLQDYKNTFGSNHPNIHSIENILEIIQLKFKFEECDPSDILKNVGYIYSAADEGNLHELETLIKNGCDVNEKDAENRTALHFASNKGHKQIVSILLRNRADATIVSNKGNTPLHTATIRGHQDVVENILIHMKFKHIEKLPDFINAKTYASGTTALHIAVKNGLEDIVKLLLSYGAEYNLVDKNMKMPSQYSSTSTISNIFTLIEETFESTKSGNQNILKKLIKEKEDVVFAVLNTRNSRGQTAFYASISNKNKELGEKLIKILKKY